MSERTLPQPTSTETRSRRFRIGALVVLALAAGLILWLVLRDDGGSSESSTAQAVTAEDLRELAQSVEHPVHWLGERDDYTLEMNRNASGSIFIRYLPSDVEPGADKPYLTVATYPFPGALQALRKVARERGASAIPVAGKGIAVPAKGYPQSVHIAYPGVDYQIEVYDPTPGSALAAVTSGQLEHLGPLEGSSAEAAPKVVPAAASRADLTALASSIGHPVYWAGPRQGFTYEVTQDPSGRVYIRYLPPGTTVGSPKPQLTVATYPFPGALAAIKAVAKNDSSTIKLPGGGMAIVDSSYPKSIHLAYPDSEYQVEVFAPTAAAARRAVASGQVAALG
jgi:hypothetical protein